MAVCHKKQKQMTNVGNTQTITIECVICTNDEYYAHLYEFFLFIVEWEKTATIKKKNKNEKRKRIRFH